jgi:hypothetical protein
MSLKTMKTLKRNGTVEDYNSTGTTIRAAHNLELLIKEF